MRFERNDETLRDEILIEAVRASEAMTNEAMRTNDHKLAVGGMTSAELPLDVGDLPDELADLALQLGSDADRLTELYPARLPAGDNELARPGVSRPVVSHGRFWSAIQRAGTLRVAAAVCILGGLTLAISGQSIWQGMLGSPPDGGPMAPSLVTAPRSLRVADEVRGGGTGLLQPVFISTEAMRQFSGEETEILADAIPHGDPAVIIADL